MIGEPNFGNNTPAQLEHANHPLLIQAAAYHVQLPFYLMHSGNSDPAHLALYVLCGVADVVAVAKKNKKQTLGGANLPMVIRKSL